MKIIMVDWMHGVTRKYKIRNEHIRGTTRVAQASKNMTSDDLNGNLRPCDEESVALLANLEFQVKVHPQRLDMSLRLQHNASSQR